MKHQIRKDVWGSMVDSDRLCRYYGRLAGKLGKREKRSAQIAFALALVTLALTTVSLPSDWILATSAALTAAAAFIPVIDRAGGRLAMASYREKALGDQHREFVALWQQLDNPDVKPEVIQEEWRELETQMNVLTAIESAEPEDLKLSKATEKETYEYWHQIAERRGRQISTTRSITATT